ncbi:MAG: N-acetylmuramoyl-L-alanine amidase [Bacteroidales bacterium]|nr:N-acetylmuramoyl-L-alanine amidase [Bacteroidales bacterium]
MKRTINLFLAAFIACFSAGAQNLSLSTVVIDPGHGGTDPGAVSRDGKTYEKNLTLDIAKKLSDKIKADCPGVKVILTRDKDKTVALNDRAAIANRVNAGLFISIHINSTAKSSPNGYSVHVLGQSSKKDRDLFAYNMDVCKRENSVILLEDDYTTTYQGFDPSDPESFIFMQLMQNSNLEQSLDFAQMIAENLKGGPISANRGVWQDPFLVLWKTSMPAVLVELGFISNSTDLDALKKDAERDKIATRLCKAFKKYKAAYDGSVALDVEVDAPAEKPAEKQAKEKPADKQVQEKPADKEKKPADTGIRYGVQIFAGASKLDPKDKAFLGYTPVIIDNGKVFKYIIGVDPSLEKARENHTKIKEKYPDSFLVKIDGDTTSRAK